MKARDATKHTLNHKHVSFKIERFYYPGTPKDVLQPIMHLHDQTAPLAGVRLPLIAPLKTSNLDQSIGLTLGTFFILDNQVRNKLPKQWKLFDLRKQLLNTSVYSPPNDGRKAREP
jgi:hypothetical protein